MPGLGMNVYKRRLVSYQVIWKKVKYLIWLYLLFIDLATYFFMHLLNTCLLSASSLQKNEK